MNHGYLIVGGQCVPIVDRRQCLEYVPHGGKVRFDERLGEVASRCSSRSWIHIEALVNKEVRLASVQNEHLKGRPKALTMVK